MGAEIIINRQAALSVEAMQARSVARVAAENFAGSVKRTKNYAALLSDLWAMAENIMDQVACSDEPLPKRVAMLKDAAKLLPLLDRAEQRHMVTIKRRAVADMTDKELEKAVNAMARARNK